MSTFIYKPDVGKGYLVLSLLPLNSNKPVWQNKYPSYTEDAESGDLIEDLTLIEMGVMNSVNDTKGLFNYLLQQGVVQPGDTIELKK